VEVYKKEVNEILNRFIRHKIRFTECIGALNAALASLIPRLKPEDLAELHSVMLTNQGHIKKEMENRENWGKATMEARAAKKGMMNVESLRTTPALSAVKKPSDVENTRKRRPLRPYY
jgi:hypothetical protein